MPSHKHLHRRQGGSARDDFVNGVESAANDLNPFNEMHTLQAKTPAPSTVYKTVYKTMEPTFEGAIGGYSTLGSDEAPVTNASPTPTQVVQAQPTNKAPVSVAQVQGTTTASPAKNTKTLPGSIIPTGSVDVSDQTTLAIATNSPTTHAQATKNVETSQATAATNAAASVSASVSTSASASPTAAASTSGTDTSGAAKAGIAIGVLGGILVVGLLIFFLFNRRRRQLEQQRIQDDEKVNGPFAGRPASMRSVQTTATAPQLSLRPVTEFMPTFAERRSSKGAAIALATGATPASANTASPQTPTRSLWERPGTSHGNDPENPFGNNAERVATPTGNDQPNNPFDAPENVVGVAQTTDLPPKPSPIATAAAAGAGSVAGAVVGVTLARQASTRKHAPAPLDLTIPDCPPSPAGTEFSVHSVAPGQSPGPSKSAAAIAAAGGPEATAVHRVQLDFVPSLEDEMELKAGQLVRLLHEYDDGWSLCIRLDRSRQGVVPRTCLSTRPVKPRPAGGPPGARHGPPVNPSGPRGPRGPGPNYPPGQRPMTPQGGPGYNRPESPMRPMTAGGRPQSPAIRPYSPATRSPMGPHGGRPASPASARPMSPGPRAQSPGPNPQSPGYMTRRMSPPGPSPMNPNSGAPQQQFQGPPQGPIGRKPVPGQAY
ncbi:hypothetical protein AAE478_001529 [Parahypoxylon ruwenzoriense]